MNDERFTQTDWEKGLTAEEVQERIESGLQNKSTLQAGKSEKQIVLENSLTFFNFIFVFMAIALTLAGSSIMNMTFMVVVVINCMIGCYQEIRAKRAVDKLTLVAAHTVKTLRDGEICAVRYDELVLDDVVMYGAGDQISADGVLGAGQLLVNESLLTGEGDVIEKNPGDALLSGSFVVAGNGKIRLTQVGDEAFANRLAAEAKKNPKAAKSEMMRSLDRLIQVIGITLVPIGMILFYQEYKVLHLSLRQSAEATVAALVGMIPEGLYLLTSVALAVSSLKLTRQRVLVKDLHCIETLARVDVLCVDKTGTITEPIIEVENVIPLSNEPPEYLEQIVINLYAEESGENETARALQELFSGEPQWELQRSVPFSSEYKWKGGVFTDAGAFVIGAPDVLLGNQFPAVRSQVDHWAALGYRVLLVAAYAGNLQAGPLDAHLIYPEALFLMTNRIRPEAPQTFRYFREQGVAIKVISGDNPTTASEVARRAGIQNAEKYIDMSTLETDGDIYRAAEAYTVFGRVTPDNKKKLIAALKAHKHTVAMTGDGVNDVLAMKEADCSIAMAGGAQAASQIAQLVLLDADFSAMPGIVGEGRRVINNIQRAAALFLVKNIFSLFLALISLVTDWPYPFAPMHLSLISALTIGVPSFFLAMEPNYERVEGRFITSVLRRAFPGGLTNIFVVVTAQAYMTVFEIPMANIQTICTAILAMTGLLVLLQVCKPFDTFRKIIWFTMAVALLFSFAFLGELFQLHTGDASTRLIMGTLLVITPVIFFLTQYLFDKGEALYTRLLKKRNKQV